MDNEFATTTITIRILISVARKYNNQIGSYESAEETVDINGIPITLIRLVDGYVWAATDSIKWVQQYGYCVIDVVAEQLAATLLTDRVIIQALARSVYADSIRYN